jgi:hypothetical protein
VVRFLLFAALSCGCGGTIAGGADASAKDAASDVIPDAGFTSTLTFEQTPSGGSFYGAFYATADQASQGCQTTKSGTCSVVTCLSAQPPTFVNAGALTIQIGQTTSSISPDAQNAYTLSPISFAPGQLLMVSNSAGADVPQFGTQITSPGTVTIPTSTPSTISTSQDFVLTWSGGESGASVVVGIARQGLNEYTSVSCTFDATAGTGTIPKAQLASLQSGAPQGDMIVGQSKSTTFADGTFVIELSAVQSQDFPVTFQ